MRSFFPQAVFWCTTRSWSFPRSPADILASGQIGPAEPYALRLQAPYLKHAYKYDALTGLSKARSEPDLHQIYVPTR